MKRVLHLITLALFLILLSPPLSQAQTAGISMEIQAGFDGFYKGSTWVPIWVTVSNDGAGVQAELQLSNDQQYNQGTIHYSYPLELPAQSRKQVALYLPFDSKWDLELKLVDEAGKTLATARKRIEPLAGDDLLVGVVAGDPSLLNGLAGLNTATSHRVAVAHLELEELPVILQPWISLDILVFNDVDTTGLTPAQQEVLKSWVGLGGRLVVGGGPGAARTLAGLTPLLPFSQVELQSLSHPLPGLAPFAAGTIPDRGPYVAAIPATGSGGQPLVRHENLPLIVRFEHHLGQIYYLALDLGLAPLDLLAGQERFFPRLMQPFQSQHVYATNWINYSQMRTSLTYIPNQPLPTPGAVTLYLLFYILIVGPVNYLFLRSMKRRDWAWLTIPVIVLLFTGVGYISGLRLRGTRPLMRQITLVRAGTPETMPLAEVSAFIGVFSPARTSYTLETQPATLVTSIPDTYSSAGDLSIAVGESVKVKDLAVDIGGMSTVVARTQAPAPQITAQLSYDRQTHRFQGAIMNGTGQPIEEAFLVIGGDSLNLGTLSPGENPVDGRATSINVYSNFYPQPTGNQSTEEGTELASHDIAVRAILNANYNYNNNPSPPLQLYLLGWQEGSPVTVDLPGHSFDRREETLLLLTLPFN